jgi:peptidoglycan/xylan/chitin deacetylase (PgdA/CDA1 family)
MRNFIHNYNFLAFVFGLVLLLTGHGWWALGIVFIGHMLWLTATLVPGCQWFGPVVQDSGNESVVLTFDDGPHPEHTPWVLEQLAQANVKAVFFLIGSRAEAHPDLARRIWAEGHLVGNHSQTHPQTKFWRLGRAALDQEVGQAQQSLMRAAGHAPILFRPPVGHHGFALAPLLESYGLIHCGWSARGFDGVSSHPALIVRRLLRKLKPGAIILLHDDRPSIRETLPPILAALRDRGLRVQLPKL